MTRLAIDIDYCHDVLQRLLAIPSPTGYTDTIVRAVCAELDGLNVDIEIPRRGAIRGKIAGGKRRPARAIISHLDTLGAQVRYLKESGRLAIAPIGHWSARFAESCRCTIFSERGAYRGTILPLKASGHTFNDEIDTQPICWDNLEVRVDALARHRSDLVRLGIDVGDILGIDPGTEFLDNGFIVSRHLDNKAGVAAMLAALKALREHEAQPPVDIYWLFSIAEEVGVGASSLLTDDIASMVTIDNGTTAPGQNSEEFGVTVAMADQTGPFDFHLTKKLVQLCRDNDIRFQKDVFRFYRSDSASAIEAGADVRTALITFGVDASHGYERVHMHALRSVAELATAYVASTVAIQRDEMAMGALNGFTTQPMAKAEQKLTPRSKLPAGSKG